jgi:hypothetical protein
MRIKLWRLAGILTIFAAIISQPFDSNSTSATSLETQSANQNSGMYIIQASYVGVSQPLRSLILSHPNILNTNGETQERLSIPKTENVADESFDSSIVQDVQIGAFMPSPLVNFDGIHNINLVFPPDTQGDIGHDPDSGTKYYVQWVNLSFQIWDVTDPASIVSLIAPTAGNTLWSGTGTICESYNHGDPITQYDHLAHRWLMSQFALGTNNYHQCLAISVSADPTGEWYLYDFQTSTSKMNDYPKFGIWTDGYYMSVNQYIKQGSNYDWAGAGVAVFERESMLAGLPARMIYIDVGAVNIDYGGMLPSDLDGPAPTLGTPNYFVEWDDSSWMPGDTTDNLRIWEFKTDWANPNNTTFGLNSSYEPNLKLTTTNVDPNMCNYSRDCIPQPGTSQKLDAITDRLMYRLQYRNFGTYKTLVTNHTVDATGADRAAIHWFELRDTGAGFSMYQEGVYSPDADHRWMGSIAMDVSGDIALGFSISSTSTYPSVRYTGRLAADPTGILPQAEVILRAGTGSQSYPSNRWGDYSMLAVDDSDGCTFWYTQQYYMAGGFFNWQTRIGAFKFPSCATPTAITLEGTVTDVSSTPIEGASIQVSGGYSTITDEAGHYAFSLKKGVYDVTVSKYGYVSYNMSGIMVMPPFTTQNFILDTAPFSTISGAVTDATTGWPLYARIDISGFPGSPVFTDPTSGAYSFQVADGPYSLSISAMSGGYIPLVLPLDISDETTQDFTLVVNTMTCAAPGYSISSSASPTNSGISPLTDCIPIPSGGLVIGAVFDTNTGALISNPSVIDDFLNPAQLIDNSADIKQVHPMYIIGEPAGIISLNANAPLYDTNTVYPLVIAQNTIKQDFNLAAGMLSASADSLAYSVSAPFPSASKTLSITNNGSASAMYEVFAIPGIFSNYAPLGPFAIHTRHFGSKNLGDMDASQIRLDLTPLDVPMIDGGSVSASWSTGLTHIWGIGFNTDAMDLWLGDIMASGGDGRNYRFSIDGVNLNEAIDTTLWVTEWNADMTYNPFTHSLWQVNVGGDNCIYEMDPVRKTNTGNKICSAFGTSERGLAFDPLTNTYFAGSWNDGIVNHFAPDGTLIDSYDVSLNISGLAFNPKTGHLFALTNNTHAENVYDVYVLDTNNSYNILGAFNLVENGIDVFTASGQSGLEIDCGGHLWAVDQFAQKVYVAESGERGICDWQVTWLSAFPLTGDIFPGGSSTLTVSVDALGMPVGMYPAYLRIVSDTPYIDVIVPITLNIFTNRFFPVIVR